MASNRDGTNRKGRKSKTAFEIEKAVLLIPPKKVLLAFQDDLFCPDSGTGEDRASLQKLLQKSIYTYNQQGRSPVCFFRHKLGCFLS